MKAEEIAVIAVTKGEELQYIVKQHNGGPKLYRVTMAKLTDYKNLLDLNAPQEPAPNA